MMIFVSAEAACVVQEVDTVPDDISLLRQTTFESMREENFKAQVSGYS